MGPCRMAWVVWLLAGLPAAAVAAESERGRITAERKAMAEQFAAQERACVHRFAVTACMDDVRARRREALAPLRERELKLDDADRLLRAQERRSTIAKRQADMAQRAPAPAESETRVRQPLLGASAPARAPRPADDAAVRAVAAERRAQELRQRQAEAKATQERIAQRQAEREAQGTKSRPLPAASAAASAGR